MKLIIGLILLLLMPLVLAEEEVQQKIIITPIDITVAAQQNGSCELFLNVENNDQDYKQNVTGCNMTSSFSKSIPLALLKNITIDKTKLDNLTEQCFNYLNQVDYI